MSSRLPAVDGLRAVAALWVVLFHISAISHVAFPQIPGLDLFMRSGSTGVSLFLVLSGFCLYLPFAAGRTARFKTGEFFSRRIRRLAPAYYVSLLLSLVLALMTAGALNAPPLTFESGLWQLGTHATFTHSLFPDTFYALNGAYWSLGLEWQLYLSLPILVLGVRRVGLGPTLAVVIACNVVYRLGLGMAIGSGVVAAGSPLADVVLPNQLFGRWAEFALGMLVADLYASRRLLRVTRFLPVMVGAMLALIPLSFMATRFELSHMLYGLLFATLLCVVIMSDNLVARAFAWRPLVVIGTMSYSLYLIHQPVIQGVVAWFEVYHPSLSPTTIFFILLMLVPCILVLAWVLFLTVERRTMGPSGANALALRLDWRLPGLAGVFARVKQTASVADAHPAD